MCTRRRILAIVALPGYALQQEHFPGQYYEQETGLFYNGYRDYDPAGGRYIESDPLGLDGGQFSTYAYVGDSPLSFVDPTRLDRQATGPAIVWMNQSAGVTYYYDPISQDFFEMPTRSAVASNAKPGASGPYTGYFTMCQRPNTAPYGTAKWMTTDPRSRWIHGGGSGLPDPLAPLQGWRPTMGCTRGQNVDVEISCWKTETWVADHPGQRIPYSRWQVQ